MFNEKTYFSGFDYLRATFCIFVVAWHNQIFGRPTYFHDKVVNNLFPQVRDVLYFNILLLAVPVFFQLALILYVINRRSKSVVYFRKRITRLLLLLFFWSSVMLFYRYFILNWDISTYFSNLTETIKTVVSGGRSIFYYFFSLIFITILTELVLCYLRRRKKNESIFIIILFVLSLIMLIFAPHVFARLNLAFEYANPLNFIPYVFSAFIVVDFFKSSNRTNILAVLFLLYLLFSVLEWTFMQYYIWSTYWGYIMPPYTRISIIFGAMFAVCLFGKINKSPSKIILTLSGYSLGIYCFHRFIPTGKMEDIVNASFCLKGMVNFTTQLLGAIIFTFLFRRIMLLRRFV